MSFSNTYTEEHWGKIVEENLEEATQERELQLQRASSQRVEPSLPPRGEGSLYGRTGIDQLFYGARRVRRGEQKDWSTEPLGALDSPEVVVVVPMGAGLIPHRLCDVPESVVFVVQSPGGALLPDALEGIAYGITTLRCPGLLLLGHLHCEAVDLCAP